MACELVVVERADFLAAASHEVDSIRAIDVVVARRLYA
jgi:hypothetical protein